MKFVSATKLAILFHFQAVLHGPLVFCRRIISLLTFRTSQNNIISHNTQFGLKVADESVRVTLISNNFFMNAKFSGALPNDTYTYAPMFIDAAKGNFSLDKNSQLIGKGTDNQDLGARIVY